VHAYMDLATDFVQGPQSDQDAPVADLAAAPGDDDRAARGHEAQGPHIGQGRVIARRTASGIGSPARHGLGCWRGPRRGRPRRCVGTGSRRTRRRRRRGRRRWSGTAAAPTHRWVPGGRLEQDRSGRGQSRCVGKVGCRRRLVGAVVGGTSGHEDGGEQDSDHGADWLHWLHWLHSAAVVEHGHVPADLVGGCGGEVRCPVPVWWVAAGKPWVNPHR
jgi:hypothetical protein